MKRVLIVLGLVGFISILCVSAEKHAVGGSQGWDESTDYDSWASGLTFKVGDELVFKYMTGLHSVVELGSESAYKSCDLGTTLDSMSSGNDVVKLTQPGTRYFACGTAGHCDAGMKVKITIGSSSITPSTPTTPSSTKSSDAYALNHVLGFSMLFGLSATVVINMI